MNKKINTLILQFHPRKEIVAEPEEENKKNLGQGRYKQSVNKYNISII